MKTIAGLLILLVVSFQVAGQVQGQRGQTYTAPWDIPALEDPYFFEPYFDTIYIHDTVYVTNADAFLKKYYKGKVNLNDLIKNQKILDSILQDLSKVSGKELFYNYFGNHRYPRALSNSISIKEFSLGEDLQFQKRFQEKAYGGSGNLNDGLLFRFNGASRTNRFLTNEEVVIRAISYIFTALQQDSSKIKTISLYFPDFNFKEKRAMAQFTKSIRRVMDASKYPTITNMKLKVFFHEPKDRKIIGEDFMYALTLMADDVILLDPTNIMDDYYVKGDPFTWSEIENLSLFTQINSHFYLAKYSTGDTASYKGTLSNFSINSIRPVVMGDNPDNNWESYLWFLIGLVFLIVLIILLYLLYPPFSYLMNQNMGIILASAIIFALEFFILVAALFNYMCTEDDEISSSKNSWILFCMPILMVVVLPLMRQFTRNKKLP
ncbi:hypothetical protein [Fluviicola sp.]|uniref:hypothetical protein n=1 Tax=Fluviicola sp. TaxID=1917219 RepID=UPI003D2A17BF